MTQVDTLFCHCYHVHRRHIDNNRLSLPIIDIIVGATSPQSVSIGYEVAGIYLQVDLKLVTHRHPYMPEIDTNHVMDRYERESCRLDGIE